MESQELRKVGLKVTHPRMRILELLEQSKPRHMTAEDIYRHLLDHGDEIGLATVYRVLTRADDATPGPATPPRGPAVGTETPHVHHL